MNTERSHFSTHARQRPRRLWIHTPLICLLVITLGSTGCRSIGAKKLAPDRFDYNGAIARSTKEQMLLNLVRLRYQDVPVFLTVSSVIAQYVIAANASISGASGRSAGNVADSVGGVIGARYAERPTMTFTPLTGDDFERQLLTTIPPALIFSLARSGWPPEQLLSMCLEQVNNISNTLGTHESTGSTANGKQRKFDVMIAKLIELAKLGGVEIQHGRVQADLSSAERSFLVFEDQNNPKARLVEDEFKKMIGLDPELEMFEITNYVGGRKRDQVTMKVRSVLTLMRFLARGVNVPDEHLEEHRVPALPLAAVDNPDTLRLAATILWSKDRPKDAFVAVPYDGYWFYIPHTDHRTKQTFALLIYLYRLQSPASQNATPILTVPTG